MNVRAFQRIYIVETLGEKLKTVCKLCVFLLAYQSAENVFLTIVQELTKKERIAEVYCSLSFCEIYSNTTI